MKSRPSSHRVRIIHYNLLSPELSHSWKYPYNDPNDLDPDVRFERICAAFLQEMKKSNAILCMQELAWQWLGRFKTFFEQNNYDFIYNLHSPELGVGIAFPRTYTLNQAEVLLPSKCFDFYQTRDEKAAKGWNELARFYVLFGWFFAILGSLMSYFTKTNNSIDIWKCASTKNHPVVFVRLIDRDSRKRFCVATYHAPCDFRHVDLMTLYSKLAAVVAWNYSMNDPFILTGDFNIKPEMYAYELLTNGVEDEKHPHHPKPPYDTDRGLDEAGCLLPEGLVLYSAYAEYNGQEPLFTNRSQKNTEKEAFAGCLDYLFFTEGIDVVDVLQLPTQIELMPTPTQGSNHLMLGATFDIL